MQAPQNPKLFRQLDRQHRFDTVLLLDDPSRYQRLLDHLLEPEPDKRDFKLVYLDHWALVFKRGAAREWTPEDAEAVRRWMDEEAGPMNLTQAEVERLADEEEGSLPEGWENTVVMGLPPRKKNVHIRLDSDIIDWFKSHGTGYQTRINAVLRSFVQTRQQGEHNKTS